MSYNMRSKLIEVVARNLQKPENTIIGRLVKLFVFEKKNNYLELEAVRLCDIKPDHKVLEVGFGPGIGIQAVYDIVKGGNGKVFGVDFSEQMVTSAMIRLRRGITEGKVELINADVANMSDLQSNTFDRVYHCNCYYFWPNMDRATGELHRVMKPGAMMVTTLNLESVKHAQSRGLLQYGNPDKEPYIEALRACGFCGVQSETFENKSSGIKFDAIFAKKSEN